MPKTSDIEIGKYIFALFTGEPGTGKTVGAGSFPGEIYFFDLDGRMAPLRKMYPDRSDIEYDTFGPDDFARFWSKLLAICDREHGKYKTIVIDSLTALARMLINFSIQNRGSNPKLKMGPIDLTSIEDFGGEGRALGKIMDYLRVLHKQGINVILTAHVIQTEMVDITAKDKKKSVTRSLMTGGKKIAAEIPAYFDEVWNFNTEANMDGSNDFYISTVRDGLDYAKTALPLPAKIVWTKESLYEKVMKEVN